jgi:SAM-dependent methyltransferase
MSESRAARWEERYLEGDPAELPWHCEDPDPVLVERVEGLPSGLILDLGCGTGTDVNWLREQGCAAFGCDVSHAALAYAQRRPDRLLIRGRLFVADARRLPVAAGSCAAVLDQGCFMGLMPEDRPAYAAEVARALPQGGVFFLRCRHPVQDEPEPNPERTHFRVSMEEMEDLFGERFVLESVGEHVGTESAPYARRRWVTWWRRR